MGGQISFSSWKPLFLEAERIVIWPATVVFVGWNRVLIIPWYITRYNRSHSNHIVLHLQSFLFYLSFCLELGIPASPWIFYLSSVLWSLILFLVRSVSECKEYMGSQTFILKVSLFEMGLLRHKEQTSDTKTHCPGYIYFNSISVAVVAYGTFSVKALSDLSFDVK